MQRADKRKYHYIYKITRNDGRFYVGMHSTDNLDDGYFGSGKLITRSIKKHGIEIHSKEILEFLPSRQLLKDREKEILTEDMRADVQCMNISPGGGGGCTLENQFKRSSAGGKNSGKFCRGSQIAHNAAVQAYEKRISSGNIANFLNNFKGKKHSEKTLIKMRASLIGKQKGEKNSQFGSCWVTDGIKPIKIKKEFLDEYLSKGYSRGRK